jgi:histidyl-tRNA synthetase
LLNEILDEQSIKEKTQVIKEIDKLDKLPEKEIRENLKKFNAEKVLDIIKNKEDYFKKYKSYKEIEELKQYCKYYGFGVEFTPSLARGLSYYTGNVFEIKSIIKETICGGGTYLVNGMNSTGISLGLERLETVSNTLIDIEKFLIVSLEQDKQSIELAQKLRKSGKNVSIYFGKPSKAMEYANSYGIKKIIFVGAKEIKQKKFKIKDMLTGKEKVVTITQIVKE